MTLGLVAGAVLAVLALFTRRRPVALVPFRSVRSLAVLTWPRSNDPKWVAPAVATSTSGTTEPATTASLARLVSRENLFIISLSLRYRCLSAPRASAPAEAMVTGRCERANKLPRAIPIFECFFLLEA